MDELASVEVSIKYVLSSVPFGTMILQPTGKSSIQRDEQTRETSVAPASESGRYEGKDERKGTSLKTRHYEHANLKIRHYKGVVTNWRGYDLRAGVLGGWKR